MKKIICIITLLITIVGMANYSFAAQGYSFELQYTGTITKDEEKNANVLLIGNAGTLYTKVRIKVDITGPGQPTILAKDSNQQEYNIAEIGYWGPPEGFAVQGDFTNTTPIRATFPEAGKYTITLSLINLEDNNNVITTNSFEIDVVENSGAIVNNTVTTNTPGVENIEELPQTGRSIVEYIIYFVVAGIIISVFGMYINSKR